MTKHEKSSTVLKTGHWPVILLAILIAVNSLGAHNMAPYCCPPPQVDATVKPNILFAIDITGSMQWRANWTVNNGYYDQTRSHYGYFDNTVDYYYASGKFWKKGYQPNNASGPFPGNIMNWACMSRIDITRKVLAGGAGEPSAKWPKNTLNGHGSGDGWGTACRLCVQVGTLRYTYTFTKPNNTEIRIAEQAGNPNNLPVIILPNRIPTGTFRVRIDIPKGDPAGMGGVIRQICDKDLDGNFDEDAPRVALLFFSTTILRLTREFWESDGASAVSAEAYMNDINNTDPSGATPVAKAVFESICYLSYVRSHYGSYICHGRGHKNDPYYTGQGATLRPVWCRKSFVIVLGDGESNSDNPYLTSYGLLPPGPFTRDLNNYDGNPEYDRNVSTLDYLNRWLDYPLRAGGNDKHHPADDYAYYGHLTDMRPDLEAKQDIIFYSIFSFGKGSDLFKEIAKDGGFDDMNGDNIPQVPEYDENGDGIPDHYYDAEEGSELEAAIMKIINEIMEQVSSSSPASVVSMGSKTGGAVAAAQFYPRRTFPTGEVLTWIGTCQSLWIDPYGWMREDNANPATLHLLDDYVITMEFKPEAKNVIITRMRDLTGEGDPSNFDTVGTAPIENLMPIWDAGKWLWNNSPAQRNIKAFIDANKNGIVDPGEIRDFTAANAAIFAPHLNAGSDSVARLLINYVRGTDVAGWRERTAGGKVWKLSDIIHSGAVVVQRPVERYDFIYGDNTYIDFYEQYKDRRQVVFAGANDGMLHCFNGGQLVELGNQLTPMQYLPNGYDLGQEIWAYVPYNLLPHLKWLKEPNYCHVYYGDMKVYITDAQIFPDDAVHPNGWGTILVGAMRLGGMPIQSAVDTCYYSYFMLDITDPVNMKPMWEFKEPNMRMSACYSTVIKVDSSWYLVFGSGPMTCSGETTDSARIYVLDLASGSMLRKITLPEANSFITNIFGVDWGMDYTVDRVYFGTCQRNAGLPGGWGGRIWRIKTLDEENPNLWVVDSVFNMRRPITAEGSVATDDHNHLWLYFGSGRFFSDVDEADTVTTQYYVGLREDTTHSNTIAGLYNVTNVWIDTAETVHGAPGCTNFTDLIDTVNARAGWYREMPGSGERSLTTSLVFGGAVLFTTFLPTGDICSYGGLGNLWALYYRTGTAYTQPFLLPDTTEERHPEWISLGHGMPSEPSLYVSSDQTKVFIQAGGGIVSPETGIPGLPASGVLIWKGR